MSIQFNFKSYLIPPFNVDNYGQHACAPKKPQQPQMPPFPTREQADQFFIDQDKWKVVHDEYIDFMTKYEELRQSYLSTCEIKELEFLNDLVDAFFGSEPDELRKKIHNRLMYNNLLLGTTVNTPHRFNVFIMYANDIKKEINKLNSLNIKDVESDTAINLNHLLNKEEMSILAALLEKVSGDLCDQTCGDIYLPKTPEFRSICAKARTLSEPSEICPKIDANKKHFIISGYELVSYLIHRLGLTDTEIEGIEV